MYLSAGDRRKEQVGEIFLVIVNNFYSKSDSKIVNLNRQQGITKRCRLSWLTISALVYELKCGGWGRVAGSHPMSTAVHMKTIINFRDLTPYLTCDRKVLFYIIPGVEKRPV
jgi:hypothetical protein